MDWLNQITDIVDTYGGREHSNVPDSVHADFDRLAQHAPASSLSEGLAAAFRSDQTPAFGTMLSQLFRQSSSTQKVNVLNSLIGTLGPTLVAQLLARHGAAHAASELQAGQPSISPATADQIPPQTVEAVAAEAEKNDPSIIERVSKFYAEQPALLKTLGGIALTVAMARIAQQQGRR